MIRFFAAQFALICGALPALMQPDVWTVAMRNGLYVDACLSCWMKWSDEHKVFPLEGFGRGNVGHERMLELLGESA